MKGIVIGGTFGNIIVRQKQGNPIELGELLIADSEMGKILLEAFDLQFGSQLSQLNIELISGLKIEENSELQFMDSSTRYYNLAILKSLLIIKDDKPHSCKSLPKFFSNLRDVTIEDIKFMTKPRNPLFFGNLRSGSKVLNLPVFLDGEKAFSHHVLIAATTGKGKSNLCSVMLWKTVEEDYCGILVLDPHDEYYGRNGNGLRMHPRIERIKYYTPNNPPRGTESLRVNLSLIKPQHLYGIVDWTDPQREYIQMSYRKYGKNWINDLLIEPPSEGKVGEFYEATKAVVRRKLCLLLDLDIIRGDGNTGQEGNSPFGISCEGIFIKEGGESIISDIVTHLESAKTVIIDTSHFMGSAELLIGSLIATEVFDKYRYYMNNGEINSKPVISILLEEAPRVLGKEILEKGPNIFSTIAREGRKFKVGLTAITQLPSLIPREILANMNTKVILGVEMKPERQAIIESAAQDLSDDDRNIASLEKGEAIITSNFARFATPIYIPLFDEVIKEEKNKIQPATKRNFEGL